MQIRTIKEVLESSIIEGEDRLDETIEHVYASDLMSDVLAFGKPNSILFTGLATQQAVVSAHMAEFKGVVFIRGKRPKDASAKFARENHLTLLATHFDMFEACVRVDAVTRSTASLPPPAGVAKTAAEITLAHERFVMGNDFANAGMVSTEVKSTLKKIGLNPVLVRRVAISTYEGEMNVVMHARRGKVKLVVSPTCVEVTIADEGKGIPDVDLAMQEGFSTATEEMRAMGFGSGMGLPNIKRNADELTIQSEIDRGTTVSMRFYV